MGDKALNTCVGKWIAAVAAAGLVWSAYGEPVLKRVVLYTSGVGYFEYEDRITHDSITELELERKQVPDVLKSLVIMLEGDVALGGVACDTRDPIEKTLQSFDIDVTGPSLSKLLGQLRGQPIRLQLSAETVDGILYGVEPVTRIVEKNEEKRFQLHLMGDGGFRSVPLGEVRHVEIIDESVRENLQSALALLAENRSSERKTLSVSYRGRGAGNLRLGYLVETPIWKTSYRLIHEPDGIRVQGWAHIENMTGHDWDNVTLSLLSGSPVSFIQNLYDPLYKNRPVVPYDTGKGIEPYVPDAVMRERVQASFHGAASARMEADKEMKALAPRVSAAGISAQASGAEAGELFEYAVDYPISLARHQSLMLPIVSGQINGRKVSIFNSSVHERHPMNSLLITNSTGLYLMRGPVTVFDDGVYAGDALLPDMEEGEDRVIPYAVDTGCDIQSSRTTAPYEVVRISIVNGVLHERRKFVQEAVYTLHNKQPSAVDLILEHPYREQWELVVPKSAVSRTRENYRISIGLKPASQETLRIIEERVVTERVHLNGLRSDRLDYYLEQKSISSAVRKAMRQWAALQSAKTALEQDERQIEKQLEAFEKEQQRIRENMKVVEKTAASYSRWETMLIEQEDEITVLKDRVADVRIQLKEKKREIRNFLENLDVD